MTCHSCPTSLLSDVRDDKFSDLKDARRVFSSASNPENIDHAYQNAAAPSSVINLHLDLLNK